MVFVPNSAARLSAKQHKDRAKTFASKTSHMCDDVGDVRMPALEFLSELLFCDLQIRTDHLVHT